MKKFHSSKLTLFSTLLPCHVSRRTCYCGRYLLCLRTYGPRPYPYQRPDDIRRAGRQRRRYHNETTPTNSATQHRYGIQRIWWIWWTATWTLRYCDVGRFPRDLVIIFQLGRA